MTRGVVRGVRASTTVSLSIKARTDESRPALISYQERTSHRRIASIRCGSAWTLLRISHGASPISRRSIRSARSPTRNGSDLSEDDRLCQFAPVARARSAPVGTTARRPQAPWSRVGTTTVENGQVCVPLANLAKGAASPRWFDARIIATERRGGRRARLDASRLAVTALGGLPILPQLQVSLRPDAVNSLCVGAFRFRAMLSGQPIALLKTLTLVLAGRYE